MEKHKTTFIQKFLLVTISTVFGLGLGEITIRLMKYPSELITHAGTFRFVANSKRVFEFIPGAKMGEDVINQQGFFDEDFVLEKPANVIRIAMLGDSITRGVKMPLGKTFSDQLENLLNQKVHSTQSSKKYEVMNFGVGGYNLEAELELLEQRVLPYKPDIVILNFFFDDLEAIPGAIPSENTFSNWFKWNVLHKSKLYRYLNYKRLQWLLFLRTVRPDMSTNNIDIVKPIFKRIQQLKQEKNFDFLICIHAHLHWQSPNNLKFAHMAENFDFPYFHMKNYYKKANVTAKDLKIKEMPHDMTHPNELGHRLIAEALYTELKKNSAIFNFPKSKVEIKFND